MAGFLNFSIKAEKFDKCVEWLRNLKRPFRKKLLVQEQNNFHPKGKLKSEYAKEIAGRTADFKMIGTYNPAGTNMPLLGTGLSVTFDRGNKLFELSNHLGNVLVTLNDKKLGVSFPSNSSLIDHFEPQVVSAQDYYPFGMLQPGRSYLSSNGEKYRYGFNGKENDNEVKGISRIMGCGCMIRE